MKNLAYLFTIVLLISCKSDPKEPVDKPDTNIEQELELSLAQEVAQQAGIDNWNEVQSLEFSFNVSKNGMTQPPRVWKWNPKTDDVVLESKGEIISYNRNKALDSLAASADRAFINDVYWLLPAYKLVWDKGTQITYPSENLIQLEYTGDGGYTPGDRYDLQLNEDQDIISWSYYPQGSEQPALNTSFENYKDYNGLRIAQDHKATDSDLNIFFTNIKVTK
jgi:hypothetical protein